MLLNPLCPLKLEFVKMQKLVFRYFHKECFSTIPTTGIIFCDRENSKIWISQISHFNPLKSILCAPWNSNFEKCRNWFFWYLYEECFSTSPKMVSYFAAEKASKTLMSEIPPFYPFKINPLYPLKLEFGKIQKLVFEYFYEECFSTIPKMVSYFAAEKK